MISIPLNIVVAINSHPLFGICIPSLVWRKSDQNKLLQIITLDLQPPLWDIRKPMGPEGLSLSAAWESRRPLWLQQPPVVASIARPLTTTHIWSLTFARPPSFIMQCSKSEWPPGELQHYNVRTDIHWKLAELMVSLWFQADASLEMEQRDFIRAGLEYVCLIQEVQERKKFEFVEIVSVCNKRSSIRFK